MDSPDQGQAIRLERWGSARAEVAVLAVHGRAQNPDVMKAYSARFTADVSYFAPRADGDSWYPEPFLVPMELNAPSVDRALLVIDKCLDQLREEGFGPRRIVLWGFSQGACVLSHHLLVRRPMVGAAVLFTGGYIGAETLQAEPGPSLAGTPIVVRSIEDDPFVPARRVRETAALLSSLGAEVDLLIAPGNDHVITDEACASGSRVLERVIAGRG